MKITARSAILMTMVLGGVLLFAPLATGESVEWSAPAAGLTESYDLHLFERLSFDLRNRRLSGGERDAIDAAITAGPGAPAALYADSVEAWMTRETLRRFVGVYFSFGPARIYDPDAETFFHRLSRYRSGTTSLYYLPHTVDAPGVAYTCAEGAERCAPAGQSFAALAAPPCAPDAIESVRPWWSDEPIRVCAASYRPAVIFDELGYCSGEAEPFMRQPPRAGCGCGPNMMGCLPPPQEEPWLDAQVATSVGDEWFETASRIVAERRPLDELVTTSRTWQSGLIEFLYTRRDAIGTLRRDGWSPDAGAQIEQRFASLDMRAAGRWVERDGIYAGTGLWWTSMAPHAMKMPVRAGAHQLLKSHLCSEFHAVNVDADAVLKAVGKDTQNLRTLSSITAAPMRFQVGCKGCHAPMDGAAGFLGEMQAAMYGSHPTGMKAAGEFFVSGAEDFRGEGEGMAALATFVVAAPEFETCSVRRAFEIVMRRPLKSRDQDLFNGLAQQFRDNGHDWRPILQAILLSDTYRYGAPEERPKLEAAHAPAEVPAMVADVLLGSCVRCHNERHVMLDLTTPPPVTAVRTWKAILAEVSEYSMPPPVRKGDIINRFPMDPSTRKSFTTAVIGILGKDADSWDPPRRLTHDAWIGVVGDVAIDVIGRERIEAVLAGTAPPRGVLAKLPPRGWPAPYALSVERAAEAICREVVRTDAQAEEPLFAVATGSEWNAPDRRASIGTLLERIYGTRPATADIDEGVALLDAARATAGRWDEAWTALCSIHLSGPDLFFRPYDEPMVGGEGDESARNSGAAPGNDITAQKGKASMGTSR